jgi:PAS domain S-box-containing protein
LEEAYNRLQCRVKEIDKEMAYTNDCLKNKVHELDNLTKYLNGLLGSIHSGVIAVNLKSEITTFNRASEKILKLQAVDVLGKKVETIFRNESNCKPLLLMALEEGENYIDVERKVETTEGLFKWIESSVSLIKDANENVIGAVEVFRDLSEIRELEMRLRHADKLATIGAMAACIAHEIRNPLNGIEGFSSLLARDFDDADPRKKLVKNIIQGTKNLNKTVTELLVFARPLKLKLSRNSISEIADKTLFFITEDMKQKGIQNIYVQKNYDLDDDTVVCDPEKLQQAFLNICMNAVQSMKNGGELVVSVRLERNVPVREVQIVIRDTGIGIKKDIIHKIFDPFFTTKQEGTGLGLAIVNRTIEAHNGKISMESVEGKGTAFFINLPRNCSYDRQIIDDAFLEEEFLSQRAF